MSIPGIDWVRIPAGTFSMGGANERDSELPVHRVYVSTFEIAAKPVTNELYGLFLNDTGSPPPRWFDEPGFDHPEQPVVGISWLEARKFCGWLSRRVGAPVRLPTEAEREKAARGGAHGKRYPWGDDIHGGGHHRIHGPLPGPELVARTRPNGYGLFNMGDNVHEWCLDGYDPNFYAASTTVDPCAPKTKRRAARGGSWRHQIVVTPCAGRSSLPPTFHYSDFGFRCARPLARHRQGRADKA